MSFCYLLVCNFSREGWQAIPICFSGFNVFFLWLPSEFSLELWLSVLVMRGRELSYWRASLNISALSSTFSLPCVPEPWKGLQARVCPSVLGRMLCLDSLGLLALGWRLRRGFGAGPALTSKQDLYPMSWGSWAFSVIPSLPGVTKLCP